jgi:hypothetical protein
MNPGDRLLYAISANREMGWPAFKRTFDLLCGHSLTDSNLKNLKLARYETVRTLDALGHLESDFGSNARLYAAPPALSVLPRSGLPIAVLSGARSPYMIDRLSSRLEKSGGKLHWENQPQHDESKRFPARVTIMGESKEYLASFAAEESLAFQEIPASWTIANFSASLGDYLSTRDWTRMDELNWDASEFDVERLHYTTGATAGETKLIRYTHPSRQYPIHYLWRGSEATRVNPDWGRYSVLKAAARNVIHYNRAASVVLIPATIPLPKLLARALCLCSGLVPKLLPGSAVVNSPVTAPVFRAYSEVPREFAQLVAAKLDQILITDFTFLDVDND